MFEVLTKHLGNYHNLSQLGIDYPSTQKRLFSAVLIKAIYICSMLTGSTIGLKPRPARSPEVALIDFSHGGPFSRVTAGAIDRAEDSCTVTVSVGALLLDLADS